MDAAADLSASRRRTVTCGRTTARAMARANLQARLLHPRLLVLVVVVALLGGIPLTTAGYPVGGVVQGLLSALFIVAVVAATSYRRALASATTLCPAGATVTVELGDARLMVRTAAGEQRLPYSALGAPRRIARQLLLPLRDVRAHVTLPEGLLSGQDVAWLVERIAHPGPATPTPANGANDEDGDPGTWPHEVRLTDAAVRRLVRCVVGYRLRGRAGVAQAVVVLALGVWLGVVTRHWWFALGAMVVIAGAVVLTVVVTTGRALRRSVRTRRLVRARFDATHVHLDGGIGQGALAYTAVRRCVVRPDAVLLLTRTGMLQVLPRELVPNDAIVRIRTAIQAESAR